MNKNEGNKLFEDKIINWYKKNKREFPWRKTKDTFHLIVAEVLLQKTRAKKVEEVYKKIVDRYPTAELLKEVNRKELRKIIRPLGLQNIRANRLVNIAKTITNDFNGNVPKDKSDLRRIKGVGEYISSAILCLGFDEAKLMVDSNVERVIGRYKKNKVEYEVSWVKEYLKSIISKKDIKKFNLGIIDLGGLICKPVNPKCEKCPIKKNCEFFENQK